MKYLFVHQNFPGQFLHIVRHLVRSGQNQVVFISEGNENVIPGVRRVLYKMSRIPPQDGHPGVREFDIGLSRAEAVANAAKTLKGLGFVPDIIIGHHGWGELLNLQDVYPEVPMLGYFEFFYHTDRYDVNFDPEFPLMADMPARIRAKNAINLQALAGPGFGQTPTRFQRDTYPEWARSRISILREGVDLDLCAPDPSVAKKQFKIKNMVVSPKEKLITYVARDLEPYRGFHVFMRALPKILKASPQARVALVGGDGVSYGARLAHGTWREKLLKEVGSELDLSRVHFLGKVMYDEFRALLRRSDAHVYLTYPFVASWSLREAMASGCAIAGSATAPVEEFITHRKTGLLVPFLEPERIADGVLELLEDRKLAKELRQNARAEAEATLCLQDYLRRYEQLMQSVAAGHLPEESVPGEIKKKSPRKTPVRKSKTG
ncbi:glycosyltransferase family 4 protein [Acetobacter sp. AN02]|uniref:glycosyltransferase family 4 protein n=1 Tax=Acetobacter sp. AN02 TaxID=2894186 RepID=UPI0024346379|nr:glycosyltransferase family 4 protein [Acetobacter sp. AN02]MDG6094026.1 glycosyltransferase family 4 protein [Acetobacter sp. AN02]